MPKSNSIEADLRSRVDAFVADLTEIIHRAALESVQEAIAGTIGTSAPSRRRSGRPRKTAKKATGRPSRGGRVRRSSEDLEQLSGAFLAYVQANPGQRLEEIGAGMGTDTKELKRPVQLLLESGSVRTEGQRRGTKYFPASGGGTTKPTKRKASKKTKRKNSKKKKSSRRGKAQATAA